MDSMKPITRKFAPNEVIPPIFNTNACIIRVTNDTIVLDRGPNMIAIRGIKKKCIGTPSGEGTDTEVTTIVNTLKRAIDIILFSLFSSFENLYRNIEMIIKVIIQYIIACSKLMIPSGKCKLSPYFGFIIRFEVILYNIISYYLFSYFPK